MENTPVTITAEVEWVQCDPEGNCECCGDMIMLVGFRLQMDVHIGDGYRQKMQYDPPIFLCSACHDAIS